MLEEATVLEVNEDGRTTVSIQRRAACGNCRICHDGEENLMTTEALNLAGAKSGDIVHIEVDSSLFFKAMILLYGIPLIVFLCGIVISNLTFTLLGFSETVRTVGSGMCGFLFMIMSFFLIGRHDEHFKNKYIPKIVKVVNPQI